MIHSSVEKIIILLKMCSLHVSEQNTPRRRRKKYAFYFKLGLVAIKREHNPIYNPIKLKLTSVFFG